MSADESDLVLYSVDMNQVIADLIHRTAEELRAINPQMLLIGFLLGHPAGEGQYQIGIIPVAERNPHQLARLLITLGLKLLEPAVQGGEKPS